MLTFEDLKKTYSNEDRELLVPVTDSDTIRFMSESKASCTWGCGTISNTGWRSLAHPSRMTKKDKRIVFVCTESDYRKAMN